MKPFPFIIGRGRSGTTVLRAMIDSHPEFAIPPESLFVSKLSKQQRWLEAEPPFDHGAFIEALIRERTFRSWNLETDEVRRAFNEDQPAGLADAFRLLYRLYAETRGKKRWADKTPSFVLEVDLLGSLFPESVFIHLIRDCRDVALSYLSVDFGSQSLAEAAYYWKRSVRTARAAARSLEPNRYMELHYEDLIDDPEGSLRSLCDFVAADFHPDMLRYYGRAEDIVSAFRNPHAHANIARPPARVRDWRRQMPRREAACFDVWVGDVLSELGYARPLTPTIGDRAVANMLMLRFQIARSLRRLRLESRRKRRHLNLWLRGVSLSRDR